MNQKILIAVGGSGGHLLPAQQLAGILVEKYSAEVVFAGFQLGKSPFFTKGGFSFRDIPAAPLTRPLPFISQSVLGIGKSFQLLRAFRPDLVVGFGSYHSFPVLAAAAMLRKKIALYEANSILGRVNRLFLPFAKKIALQFPLQKFCKKGEFVSYFPWIQETRFYAKEESRQFYGLNDSLPVCLVFGGSQGAAFFNEKAPSVLSGFQVIHCTGKQESVAVVATLYEEKGIKAFVQAFESDMRRAYAAADFALCRSGAATICELMRQKLPAVLVPFPFASDDHQTANAKVFSEKIGGGFTVPQNAFHQLRPSLEECLSQSLKLKDSIQSFYQKNEKRVELADLLWRL